MIDIHAHYFPSPDIYSPTFLKESQRMRGRPIQLVTDYSDYWTTAEGVSKTIVFGGKARSAGLWVNDADVAAFVDQHPDRLIGFQSLDPTQKGWQEEMIFGHRELKLRGIKLMPMYAGFFPQDRSLDFLWRYASDNHLPVLLHTGTTFVSNSRLEVTRPVHIDEVAIRFPDVKIVMAHLGHPYEGEAIAVIRKHANVYSDISALYYRPFQLFHSLMLAQEYGVFEKILFGSDYPIANVRDTLAGLRKIGTIDIGGFQICRDSIEGIIHRDSLSLLNLCQESNLTPTER